MMRLPNGQTLCYGIFGYPVKHSLSPVFQSYAFNQKNINAIYIPFEVKPEDLKDAVKGAKVLSIKGLNITIPHKESILEFVDEVSEDVKKIGSCNTLKFEENIIKAYNTDYIGFKRALEEKTTLNGKKALVLGAGGTSKAIIYALVNAGTKVYLYNRTIEKALKLKEIFNIEVVQNIECMLDNVDIIVNTTSIGLKDDDKPLFDYDKISAHHIVFDVIYKNTLLIKKAKEKEAVGINGLPMLVYQGLESFKIWTGIDAFDIAPQIFELLESYTF
ncbi:shikimate dehydrogenase [Hydrogenobaculum acidophilum]